MTHLIAQICALSSLLIAVTLAVNCPRGTYKTQNTCKPCPATSFSNDENLRRCQRCQSCFGSKFRVERQCTAISNTKCGCVQGYMCSNDACDQCMAHRSCLPGQRIVKEGTSNSDTECTGCDEGSFSKTEGEPCIPWTDCSTKGMFVTRNGSSTQDRECSPTPPRSIQARTYTASTSTSSTTPQHSPQFKVYPEKDANVLGILAAFLVPCLFIPFTMFAVILTRKRHKRMPKKDDTPVAQTEDDACSCHYPVKELGDDSTDSSQDSLLTV
ncbi:tumor necrosis factor receptor superfamily member 9 [Callorhinchus milii]|uniref:Tumor necrosis factor receptor superfamily member 9 n=1 Tax=Callorhinchus milii TaxID=7868 RepID=V9L6P5_CALMI|nr:tumor necrosis factor receptor superfamily member 9 [Callorhinchus milii]|eukprot:gi/632968052/ref/XP_007900319.1/ PREDICTED: tumor necrosis factor receptor superfamily member 9 [Callorhinchus milii]